MGFLTSIFTPPGTAAANRDRQAKERPQAIASEMLNTIQPSLQSGAGLFNRLQPMAERGAMDVAQLSGPAGQFQAAEAFRRRLLAQAMQQYQLMRNRLQAGGAGIGGLQGAQMSSINQAHMGANDMQRWYGSQEGRLSAARAIMEAQQGALPLPALGGLNNIIQNRQAPPVGQGFGGMLGQGLGMAAGMGWNPFGGGGGGGGGGVSNPPWLTGNWG